MPSTSSSRATTCRRRATRASTSSSTNHPPHPEEPRKARRLEGWQRTPSFCPPFETLATLAPQGEVSLRKADVAVGIELLHVDVLVGQRVQPHRAEERLLGLDQQDGLGEP